MYLQKNINPKTKRVYLQIVHKYRDKETKKIRSKTIKSIGYLDELEKQYDDPIAYFSALAKKMDEERRETSSDYCLTINRQERLPVGTDLTKNFGYAAASLIYHQLGIHSFLKNRQRHTKEMYDANVITQLLIYNRLLFPGSKKAAFENRTRFFEKTNYSLDDIYRCLSFLNKHREAMQIWLNQKIKENYGRDSSLIYYDVTNYYFETDNQDEFIRKGVCKEHRPNPIVQMGLFMDNNGIPVTYELFPGNTNDCLTYRPNFGRIKKQFDLGRVICVADKGMTTGDNIWYTINTPAHDGYVFSLSVRGAEKALKKYVTDEKDYVWIGKEYKCKSRKCPRTIHVTTVSGKKMDKLVDEKQIVFWSEKYAKRARAERDAALAKAQDLAAHPGKYNRATSYGAAKYVKKIEYDKETGEILTASSVLDIDEDLIEEEKALDGYYVLLTSEMDTPDNEIIDIYRGLWKIEESFKVTKSELESRPVFVWTHEHIEAHFLTCFIALTIARILEMKLNYQYSIRKILDSLARSNCCIIEENLYLFTYYDEVLRDLKKITGIEFDHKVLTLKEIKKYLGDTKKSKK